MQTLNTLLAPILNEIEDLLNRIPLSNEHEIIKHLQDKNPSTPLWHGIAFNFRV